MLIRDGHIECWIPEDLIDLSACSFAEPARPPLLVFGVVLESLTPRAAIDADLASARAGLAGFDASMNAIVRQQDFVVDGQPGARAVLEVKGTGRIFQASAYVRTSESAGVHLFLNASSDAPVDHSPLEEEFSRVIDGLFIAATSRPVAPAAGRALRVFGRLGISVPVGAVPQGQYRYRGLKEPALIVGLQSTKEPTLEDIGYTSTRDAMRSLERVAVTHPARSHATREDESWERMERSRPARLHSPASTDEHYVRRFATHRKTVTPGLPTSAFAVVAAPASRRALVDAFWDRVTGSCRLEGTP